MGIPLFLNADQPGLSMPSVMGILNVTPDSFSDGGRFLTQDAIERQVLKLISDGASILDIGGESTRPGAQKVSLDEEMNRVMPVVEWVVSRFDVMISVDTYKVPVMREALKQGVHMINDVNALQAEGAMALVAQSGAYVCLMHKKGEFATMQEQPVYENVVLEVRNFLLKQALACESEGVRKDKIILDPGFGFGKTLSHNEALFQNLELLVSLGYPILVGVSRKKMIADILDGASVADRVNGSVASAVLAALKGAKIVRVHDVKETVEALKVTMRLL